MHNDKFIHLQIYFCSSGISMFIFLYHYLVNYVVDQTRIPQKCNCNKAHKPDGS